MRMTSTLSLQKMKNEEHIVNAIVDLIIDTALSEQ